MYYYLELSTPAPVVKWISRQASNLLLGVRISPGAQHKISMKKLSLTFFILFGMVIFLGTAKPVLAGNTPACTSNAQCVGLYGPTYLCCGGATNPNCVVGNCYNSTPPIVCTDPEATGLVPCGVKVNPPPAGSPSGTQGTLACPCTLNHFFIMALRIVNFMIWILGVPLATLMIVIGGLLIMLSGVNPEWVSKGKHMLLWAIISIALMLGSWLIINFVLAAIGYNPVVEWWKPF